MEHNLLHSGQRGLGIANVTKLGFTDKSAALKKLHEITIGREKDFTPNSNFDELIQKERNDSWKYGGRTVSGDSERPQKGQGLQLELFWGKRPKTLNQNGLQKMSVYFFGQKIELILF